MEEVSGEFQTQSILRNENFLKIVSKTLSPRFLEGLLPFYHLNRGLMNRLSYGKTTKAVSILKVLEVLLKKIQKGRLSKKNMDKLIQANSNIFLSETNPGNPDLRSSREEINVGTLQVDFFETLGLDLKQSGAQDFQLKGPRDVALAMDLVRLHVWLLDLKNLVSSPIKWDSQFLHSRFGAVKETRLEDPFRQEALSLFRQSSFDLQIKLLSDPLIFGINSPQFNERFFPFRKLKR